MPRRPEFRILLFYFAGTIANSGSSPPTATFPARFNSGKIKKENAVVGVSWSMQIDFNAVNCEYRVNVINK